MSTVLYTVTCYDALFDGYYDSKYKRGNEDPEMKLIYCIFQTN